MKPNIYKMVAVLGLIPVFAFANPFAAYYDPLFSHEPHSPHGMPHRPPHHPDMKCGEFLPPYLQGVELMDAQKKSIQELIQKNQTGWQAKEKRGFEYRNAIQAKVFSKEYSEQAVTEMIKKSLSQHEEKALSMAKLDRAIFDLLTVSQQQQVQANFKKFSEGFEQKH
ncbi:Spy/CpxP family protein refolding chaperone [Methylosarcina fibrata]|uniref:Spy/CpxP family protein refolding chaperone n=1 Tax=Methylosarcina fibrata TaxID=105972 RepID=UPI0012FC3CC1|nr:Spy/CpxP family protein refolding chaperone [Methylosarcina fibrata]